MALKGNPLLPLPGIKAYYIPHIFFLILCRATEIVFHPFSAKNVIPIIYTTQQGDRRFNHSQPCINLADIRTHTKNPVSEVTRFVFMLGDITLLYLGINPLQTQ